MSARYDKTYEKEDVSGKEKGYVIDDGDKGELAVYLPHCLHFVDLSMLLTCQDCWCLQYIWGIWS